MRSTDERDLAVMFIQWMIRAKKGQSGGAPLFGEPIRVPNHIDESMLYDPKKIALKQPGRDSVGIPGGNRQSVGGMPGRPSYVKPISVVTGPQQAEDNNILENSLIINNDFNPVTRFSSVGQNPKHSIFGGEQQPAYNGQQKVLNLQNQGPRQSTNSGPTDELLRELVRLREANKILQATNGSLISSRSTFRSKGSPDE